jgi:hypothetical protein
MTKSVIKKRKTYDLRLTKSEILHLRDLFSIVLPPTVDKTVSQALAELEGRTLIESSLWQKVSAAALAAGLPVGSDAPDYVVAPTGSPALSVFQMTSDEELDDSAGDEEE